MINKEQEKAVVDILKNFKSNKPQILAWYTGSGKTNIFLEVARRIIKKEPNAKIGVSCYLHSTIKTQTAERAVNFLDDGYVFRAKKKDYADTNVYFFNPQTIYKRTDFPFKFDYLIIDEAHIGMSDDRNFMMLEIFRKYTTSKTKILGCTATPWLIIHTKFFKDAIIHKRGLDAGFLEDKRICDFNINTDRFSIKTTSKDFSKYGDLTDAFIRRNFEIIKAGCLFKIKSILSNHKDKIGDKCLVIVPGGNYGEIAKLVQSTIGRSALSLIDDPDIDSKKRAKEEQIVINRFKNDDEIKFLIVIHKCQIGFDMPQMSSTIDLTITRNVSLLVQRWGRLARLYDKAKSKKNYFYVVDDSMTPEESEWIIGTSVDYAIGNWESVKSKKLIKQRETPLFNISGGEKTFSISFAEAFNLYKNQRHTAHKSFSFSEKTSAAGTWSKQALLKKAAEYKDRTELSAKNRYVYKKLMQFYTDDLDKMFPMKKKYWTVEECLELAKKFSSIKQFKKKYPSAHWHLEYKGHGDKMREIINKNKK